jgi:hypothetical protein
MTVAARGISNQYTQVLGDIRQRLYQASAEICSDFQRTYCFVVRKSGRCVRSKFPDAFRIGRS